MSKENTQLAEKIVNQLAELEPITMGHGFTVRVPHIGYRFDHVKTEKVEIADRDRDGQPIKDGETTVVDKSVKTTETEAKKMAIANIAKQLDDGEIELSDDWASTNL